MPNGWMKCALACTALAAGLSTGGAQAQTTLNWVTYKPQGAGDPQAITTQWFADEVEKRTNGEYDVRIHWGGSLATINEIPNALENGIGEIGDVVTPYFPDQLLVNNAISFFVPQPHSSLELGKLMDQWYEKYPQFSEEMARYNMKTVGLRPLEAYGMICTTPIRSMADFEGKRVRVYGFALPALIETLGAVPVSMGTPETYEALERGILDCSPVGPTLAHGWRYDEVAKYYIEVPLGASWGHLIAMNLDAFNSLPEDVQKIITDVGDEYLQRYIDEMDKAEKTVRDAWAEGGTVEVIEFPREEFVAAISESEAIQQIRDEWVERASATGLPAEEIAESLRFQ